MKMTLKILAALCVLIGATGATRGGSITNPDQVYITEFCSDTGNNEKFEFVEITNISSVSVNMSGWSEDDSNAQPNQPDHSLSAFDSLAPGESGIFTEATPANFRAYWGLPTTVKVIGPYSTDNLATGGDSITLFDSLGKLVDRLDYGSGVGDAGVTHATRTAPLSALGQNNSGLWVNSTLGDSFGSYTAARNGLCGRKPRRVSPRSDAGSRSGVRPFTSVRYANHAQLWHVTTHEARFLADIWEDGQARLPSTRLFGRTEAEAAVQ